MARQTTNWPTLLTDGGWREQRRPGEYWPSYYRVRRSVKQKVTHNEDFAGTGRPMWVLEHGANFVLASDLSAVLYRAESCN